MRAIVIGLVVAACTAKSPAPKVAIDAASTSASALHLEPTPESLFDAAPAFDAAPPGAPPRLAAYLRLLSADMYMKEIVEAFPGAPKGAVFDSKRYWWHFPDLMALDELYKRLEVAAKEASAGPLGETDKAVGTYVHVALDAMAPVFDLAKYYDDDRFVDDEFERGRRDSGLVAAAGAALAKVRKDLWSRVIVEWREVAGDDPDSPRGITGAAFETCLQVGAVMVTTGLGDAANAAVSACRKAIAPVAALPDGVRNNFDQSLRSCARELGDLAATGYNRYQAPRYIDKLTEDYLALWPLLPQAPAEQSH